MISYRYHLLNVRDLAAHRKFWIDALGGVAASVEGSREEAVRFGAAWIFLRQQVPTGNSKGTTVNHFGLQVPDVRGMVDRMRAAGYPITTARDVSPANLKNVRHDLAFVPDQNLYVAYVEGPDATKLELLENKVLSVPIALHHIHFFTPDVTAMKAWYVRVFQAKPGKRGSFEAADVSGVNLTFSATSEPLVGTRSRLLDHIGFEVEGLKDFCRGLAKMGVKPERSYTAIPEVGISNAFILDPWGTYIGLADADGPAAQLLRPAR